MKYRIKSTLTDTKNISVSMYDLILKESDDLLCSIGYNNDYLLRGNIKSGRSVFTSISSLYEYETLMKFHLTTIQKSKVDTILLEPTDMDEVSLTAVARANVAREIGLKDPEIKDIGFYKTFMGIYPSHVLITVNPLKFPKGVIDFCQENKIKVIGYDIYGPGENLIPQWGIGYLTSFAAFHCDSICIPSQVGYEKFMYMKKISEELIDSEVPEENITNFEMAKDINIQKTPPQQLVSYFLRYNGSTINIGFPEDIPTETDIEFSVGTTEDPEHILPQETFTDIEKNASILILSAMSESDINSEAEMQAYVRYISLMIIQEEFSTAKHLKFEYEKIGNIFILRLKHKFYWWVRDSFMWSIRQLPNGTYRFLFVEDKKKSRKA